MGSRGQIKQSFVENKAELKANVIEPDAFRISHNV